MSDYRFKLILLALSSLFECGTTVRDFACEPNGFFPLTLTAGSKEIIYSHPRGGMYSGAKSCLWFASCPDSFDVHLDCPFVNIPESEDCESEYLMFLTRRDVRTKKYCGSDSIEITSDGPNIGVYLEAPANTTGGMFVCQVSCRCTTMFISEILE